MTEDISSLPPTSWLHVKVRESLRAKMQAGEFAVGEKLPSEHSLCGSFGVSRITIRQALADLERDGAIDRIHGRGTFVRAAKAYQEVSELQGFSEAMTPLGHQVVNRLHAFCYVPSEPDIARNLGIAEGSEAALIERVRVLDGRPVSLERSYIAAALGQQLASADLVTRDLFGILEDDLQRPLGHALVAMDATAADTEQGPILNVLPGTPLLRVERKVFDTGGQPLVYENLWFRTDFFQYRMRIDRVARQARK